jgi:hypothetical protein
MFKRALFSTSTRNTKTSINFVNNRISKCFTSNLSKTTPNNNNDDAINVNVKVQDKEIEVESFPLSTYRRLQNKTQESINLVTAFVKGPLKFNLKVGWEVARLIAREQKLLPSIDSWPAARAEYRSVFLAGRQFVMQRNFREKMQEMTWGDLGSAARITAEMAAFYYIGKVIGITAGLF